MNTDTQKISSTRAIAVEPSAVEQIVLRPLPETTVVISEPGKVARVTPVAVIPTEVPLLIRSVDPAIIEARRLEPALIRPSLATRVDPPQRGAWDESGWTMRKEGRNEIYEGHYRAMGRTFAGRIQVEGRQGRIAAFIHEPPAEIKRHNKGACFQQCGIGTRWFRLHWHRPAQNVDDAILYVERVLDEALRS